MGGNLRWRYARLGSTGGLRHLIVFGDNDENFTGQTAAYSLANRLSLKGIKTEVRIPAKVGTDWADE